MAAAPAAARSRRPAACSSSPWAGYSALSGKVTKKLKTAEMSEAEERTAVAVGLLAYAHYCFAQARYRRV